MPIASSGNVITNSAQLGADVVLSTAIKDGEIANADIAGAAAIAGSKIQALSVGANAGVIPSTGIVNDHIAAGAAIIDSKLAQIATASKVSGAALTSLGNIPAGAGTIPQANLPSQGSKVIAATRAYNGAAGAVNYAHGLGKTPTRVKITAGHTGNFNVKGEAVSIGVWDGTNTACWYSQARITTGATVGSETSTTYIIYISEDTGAYQRATVSVDGTNVILDWTKSDLSNNDGVDFIIEVW
jgi:hypothetical protein